MLSVDIVQVVSSICRDFPLSFLSFGGFICDDCLSVLMLGILLRTAFSAVLILPISAVLHDSSLDRDVSRCWMVSLTHCSFIPHSVLRVTSGPMCECVSEPHSTLRSDTLPGGYDDIFAKLSIALMMNDGVQHDDMTLVHGPDAMGMLSVTGHTSISSLAQTMNQM